MVTEDYRILTPAYGRDYKSRKEAEEAFRGGKDFQLQPEGCYCSIRDFTSGVKVEVWYKKKTMVTIVTV